MKILYLDLGMGAAGDMLCAALLDLLDDEQRQSVLDTLNNAGIPQVVYRLRRDEKCGITGLHLDVLVDGHEEGHDHHDQDHDVRQHPRLPLPFAEHVPGGILQEKFRLA